MRDSDLDDAGYDSGQEGLEAYVAQIWWETLMARDAADLLNDGDC